MASEAENTQLPLALARVKRSRENFVHKLPDDSGYKPAPYAVPVQMPQGLKNKRRRGELYWKLKAQQRKLRSREKIMRRDEKREAAREAKRKERFQVEESSEEEEEEEEAVSARVEEDEEEEPLPKKHRVQRTLENTREKDVTTVLPDDEEVERDQAVDEFAARFDMEGETPPPKLVFTTCNDPTPRLKSFVRELSRLIPNSEFRKRNNALVKPMVAAAIERGYTALVIVEENNRRIDSMLLINLPDGPTAHFRLTSVQLGKELHGHGRTTKHLPEVILNNFTTRLGHTVGRMFASLFPPAPEFKGRRVVTFHNQRDFIFFRQHRYIFESGKKVRLQELGPRFTMELISLQKGTFDTKFGEYLWIRKTEMETSRRRFFL